MNICAVFVCPLCSLFLVRSVYSLRAQSKPAADLIINTPRSGPSSGPSEGAGRCRSCGDRIVAVGTDADVDAWRGPQTKPSMPAANLSLPGFNDSHVALRHWRPQLDHVQLNDVTSAQEFARRIGERAKNTPKGAWILGGDWDETKWTPAEFPTKELIDPRHRRHSRLCQPLRRPHGTG